MAYKKHLKITTSELNSEQHQLMIGSLLGDGFLRPYHPTQKAVFAINRKDTDVNYLTWEFSKIKEFFSTGVSFKDYYNKDTQKTYHQCYISSRSCNVFYKYYNEWYKDGIKIIPNNIELTPLIIATWFCDDGTIRCKLKNKIEIKISTHCFHFSEVEMLVNLLQKRYKENFYVGKDGGKPVIYSSDYASRMLINECGDLINEMLPRKAIWTNLNCDLNHSDFYKRINNNVGILKILNKENSTYNEIVKQFSLFNHDLKLFATKYFINKLLFDKLIINGNGYNCQYSITNLGKKYLIENENHPLIQL